MGLEVKRRIWTPAPIVIGDGVRFNAWELEAYERELLARADADEHDASRFFQMFPKFLHFGQTAEVRREVVLAGTQQRVDFFRRSFGEVFWDIVELKHPQKPLIAGADTLHPRLTAEVDKAINQALDYRDLIDSDGQLKAILTAKGIHVCRPQLLVIVGKNNGDVDPERLRVLYDRIRQRGPIDLRSYTDIYRFAKEHYRATKTIVLPAFHFAAYADFGDVFLDHLADRISSDPELLYTLSARRFEELVAHILSGLDYSVTLSARRGDGGRDLVAVREGIGTSKLLIECKRYSKDRKVGVDTVRAVHGSVMHDRATKGLIITTGQFTREAVRYLDENRWLLEGCDPDRLTEWISEYKKRQRADSID